MRISLQNWVCQEKGEGRWEGILRYWLRDNEMLVIGVVLEYSMSEILLLERRVSKVCYLNKNQEKEVLSLMRMFFSNDVFHHLSFCGQNESLPMPSLFCIQLSTKIICRRMHVGVFAKELPRECFYIKYWEVKCFLRKPNLWDSKENRNLLSFPPIL